MLDLEPGETYLSDTPVLAAHTGTQPDLFLRWNRIPRDARAVDVAVFLHGFSQSRGDMQLTEKVERSGLILTGRTRPTLALLPRGNWIRHYAYDFPALLGGGIDLLLAYGLHRLSQILEVEPLALDRLVLAAHSGGGMPAIDIIADAQAQPDELYIFDGLYGRDPAEGNPLEGIEIVDRWLAARFAAEPGRPGALRVPFIARETGQFSRAVGQLVAARLDDADPGLRLELAKRYRVEEPRIQHSQIARIALPELLAASDADIPWYLPSRF
jgi:pimeloyl-ACP methyl ester carboxylesterase